MRANILVDAYRSHNLCLQGSTMIKLSDKDQIPCGARLHSIWERDWCTQNLENSLRQHIYDKAPSIGMAFVWRNRLVHSPTLGPVDYMCCTHKQTDTERHTPRPLNLASTELVWLHSHPFRSRLHSAGHEAAVPPRRLLLTSGSHHSKVAAEPHLSTCPRIT